MTESEWADIIGDADGLTPWESDAVTGDGRRVCTVTVAVPSDLFTDAAGEPDRGRMLDYAIDAAREAAPDWCVPATWSAVWADDDGDEWRATVTRESDAGPDRLAAEGAARVAAGDASPD